jgi:Tol biopolymer transport system component
MKRFALIVCLATLMIGLAAPPAGATFPGTEGKIAFETFTGRGRQRIGTIDGDGSDRTTLVTSGLHPDMPGWSADGTKIAYADADDGLRTMNADGSSDRLLVADTRMHTGLERPTWSPDGTQLAFDAFVGPLNGYRLFVVNDDGSGLVRIDSARAGEILPEWSPDGSRIAFVSYGRRGHFIRTIDPDGTARTTVTGGYGPPSWSPDGSELTFIGGRDNDVFVVNTDGTGRTRLTATARRAEYGSVFSPDGARIAFSRGSIRGFFPTDIWVMNADGTSPTAITATPRRYEFPWSWQAT